MSFLGVVLLDLLHYLSFLSCSIISLIHGLWRWKIGDSTIVLRFALSFSSFVVITSLLIQSHSYIISCLSNSSLSTPFVNVENRETHLLALVLLFLHQNTCIGKSFIM